MSIIGNLKPVRNGANEELHGEIKTLQFSVKVRLVPELIKTNDQSPDYKIFAFGSTGELTEIGAAWQKTKQTPGEPDFEFLSITIDDMSFPNALNVAAFKNKQGGWDITWRRRLTTAQSAA